MTVDGGLSREELARHLSHAETQRLARWCRVVGSAAIGNLVGLSRERVRGAISWRRCRREDLRILRDALRSTAVIDREVAA